MKNCFYLFSFRIFFLLSVMQEKRLKYSNMFKSLTTSGIVVRLSAYMSNVSCSNLPKAAYYNSIYDKVL